MELRTAEVAAAARKGKNKGGFVPKWPGQKPGCKAKLPEMCKCGQRKGKRNRKLTPAPQIVSKGEGQHILKTGVKGLRDIHGNVVDFSGIAKRHLVQTPKNILERAKKELSEIKQWQDTHKPEIRDKLEESISYANRHLNRPEYVNFAIDATRNGTPQYDEVNQKNGHTRWIYEKDYKEGEKQFTMHVATEQMGRKRRSVITFYNISKK